VERQSLNAVYAKPAMRRRYEVWFLRLHLTDGSGAWWFRYVLLNPGRPGGGGCAGRAGGEPLQVWATWFPRGGAPQSVIQGFPQEALRQSAPGASPFYLEVDENRIEEDSCRGRIEAGGQVVSWDLHYQSTFGASVTDWGWIGFSRTPHSDAVFSGTISFNGRTWRGEALGYGLQGHNCGFRHRHRWSWTHCLNRNPQGGTTTFEALEYEIPLGLRVQRALLWHSGRIYAFKRLEELERHPQQLQWSFRCTNPREGVVVAAVVNGSGALLHRLPYLKTDCSGTFDVANNSLARATLYISRPGVPTEEIQAEGGASVEMVGD
jgi:hypothetical protein